MSTALQGAIERVESLLEPRQYPPEHPHLHAVSQLPNGNRILRRISRSESIEDFRDYLAEVYYALTFVGLGYQVEVEPEGVKGPDLCIQLNGHTLLTEVTRLRFKHDMPLFDPSDDRPMLADLGDPLEDVRRAFQKFRDKLRQLSTGPGMVAVWNDDGILDELHARTAALWLREEISADRLKNGENLELAVFHTNWISPSDPQEFFTWTFRHPASNWLLHWQDRLESARLGETHLAALQRLGVHN